MAVKHGGADLIGALVAGGDAGALGVDDQLTGQAGARLYICQHLGDCRPALATVDENAADAFCIPAQKGRPAEDCLHHEFAARQGAIDHDDIQKALMLGGDQHLASGHGATDFGFQPANQSQRKADPAAIGVAGGHRAVAVQERIGKVDNRHHRHRQIHLEDEDQRQQGLDKGLHVSSRSLRRALARVAA